MQTWQPSGNCACSPSSPSLGASQSLSGLLCARKSTPAAVALSRQDTHTHQHPPWFGVSVFPAGSISTSSSRRRLQEPASEFGPPAQLPTLTPRPGPIQPSPLRRPPFLREPPWATPQHPATVAVPPALAFGIQACCPRGGGTDPQEAHFTRKKHSSREGKCLAQEHTDESGRQESRSPDTERHRGQCSLRPS